MSENSLVKFGGAMLNEALAHFSIPGGAVASALLSGVFEKKAAEAREILLEEISQGTLPEMAEDDAVYIIYRYLRAAQEGSARLNLRLLAQVVAGSKSGQILTADHFLYYADVISSLRYDEIVLLGTFIRRFEGIDNKKDDSFGTAMKNVQADLIPAIFPTEDDFKGCASAVLRTGLLTAISGWGSLLYEPTPSLFTFASMLSVDDALARERAGR